jgi:hypothetical protein
MGDEQDYERGDTVGWEQVGDVADVYVVDGADVAVDDDDDNRVDGSMAMVLRVARNVLDSNYVHVEIQVEVGRSIPSDLVGDDAALAESQLLDSHDRERQGHFLEGLWGRVDRCILREKADEEGDEGRGMVEAHDIDASKFPRVHRLLHNSKKLPRYRYHMPIGDFGQNFRRRCCWHVRHCRAQEEGERCMNHDHSPFQDYTMAFDTRHGKVAGN